jgi:hypothetical protein
MTSAHNAELGVKLARDIHPDLILMDVNLPGINGFAALEKLRADIKTKDIPVISVTANALPQDVERGKEVGFEGYLIKPINVPEVIRLITSHIS